MTLSRDRAPACSANVPFLPSPRIWEGFSGGGVIAPAFLGCAGSRASLMAAMMAARMVGRLAGPLPVRLAAGVSAERRISMWWCASIVARLCGPEWAGSGSPGRPSTAASSSWPWPAPAQAGRHLGRRGRPAVGSKERGPMSEPMTPRRGMRFLHAHQITPAPTAKCPAPEPCRVTRVTKTTRLLPQ